MEVGEQRVDHAEAVARADEDARSRRRPARTAPSVAGRALERAHHRRADRDHAAAARARAALDRLAPSPSAISQRSACIACSSIRSARTGWNVPAPTCSVTRAISTPRALEPLEQRRREVQARGGRRHRAGVARVDRLVALAILRLRRVVRGRCRAATAAARGAPSAPAPATAPRSPRRACPRLPRPPRCASAAPPASAMRAPTPAAPARSHHRLPSLIRRPGAAAAAPPHRPPALRRPQQPRRNHPAPVHHQTIPRPQKLRQLREPAILPRLRRPIQHEEPRSIPRLRRLLRNQLGRQLIVEEGSVHRDCSVAHAPPLPERATGEEDALANEGDRAGERRGGGGHPLAGTVSSARCRRLSSPRSRGPIETPPRVATQRVPARGCPPPRPARPARPRPPSARRLPDPRPGQHLEVRPQQDDLPPLAVRARARAPRTRTGRSAWAGSSRPRPRAGRRAPPGCSAR